MQLPATQKIFLEVKTALTGAGHLVSALINDGMFLQDGTTRNNRHITILAHRTCETICPGINIHWIWPPHDATIRNNADATFGTLRVLPHIPSPSHRPSPSHTYTHAPHCRVSPHAATYTNAS